MNSNTDFEKIAQLDLDPIKVKLMHKESGEGWSLAYATLIEGEYRRFLCLMKRYPDEPMAPLFDVDIFWHYHILDTMKYAADCDAVFGYFLHHFPYLGLRGEDDEAAHHRVGARMKELYEATFGASLPDDGDAAVTGQTAWSMNGAATDGAYSVRPSMTAMGTAWSMSGAQNGSVEAVRPSTGSATTAWSMNQAPNEAGTAARPTLVGAVTAWSMNQAQNAPGSSARPALRGAITAWSMNQAKNTAGSTARPTLGSGLMAWSMNQAHNENAPPMRPSLASSTTAWSMNTAHSQGKRLDRPALAAAA
jgi:hypothetical protein